MWHNSLFWEAEKKFFSFLLISWWPLYKRTVLQCVHVWVGQDKRQCVRIKKDSHCWFKKWVKGTSRWVGSVRRPYLVHNCRLKDGEGVSRGCFTGYLVPQPDGWGEERMETGVCTWLGKEEPIWMSHWGAVICPVYLQLVWDQVPTCDICIRLQMAYRYL